jgi:glycosyltransferase involved in cell wall biosynthesis
MHILFLSQLVPYPVDAGPKVRSYHVLQYLAAAGHQVTLVAFCRETDRPEHIAHLRQFCSAIHTVPIRRSRVADVWHLFRSLITNQPFLIARDWSSAMAQQMRQLVQPGAAGLDIVHADQLWMAPYALLAKSKGIGRTKVVLDAHNAVFQIPQRMAANTRNPLARLLLDLEARKLAHYEADTCRRFDHVVTVTTEDQQTLSRLMTEHSTAATPISPQVKAIPICVDPTDKAVVQRTPNVHRVTFLGGLHWPPNAEGIVWFAREVWPRVIQRVPATVLTVIGKDPPMELVQSALANVSFDITGYVSDPMPYLRETAAFVVPLRAGGGMRVKIVDAWSWGLPVVSTTVGAEGLEYHDGDNLLIGDTPEAFAQSLVRLLTEPELAARVSAAGRRTIEECYDWHKIYPAWDEVYEEALSSTGERRAL